MYRNAHVMLQILVNTKVFDLWEQIKSDKSDPALIYLFSDPSV